MVNPDEQPTRRAGPAEPTAENSVSGATFEALQPLPPGTTLLEASAGTGKTWSITTLVLRLVAENGLRMPELLLVTFTRAATEELKDRVRSRLVEAAAALAPGAPTPKEPTLAEWIARADPEERRRWLSRLTRAQEEFDQAAISTIHAFCQRALRELAFESGAELGLELNEDPRAILDELIADLLTTDLVDEDAEDWKLLTELGWTLDGLAELAKAALQDPRAAVVPAPATLQALCADWAARRGSVADQLRDAWGPSVVAAVDEALQKGILKKKQSTWTRAKAEAALAEAVAGLRAARWPTTAALGAFERYLFAQSYRDQLADPEVPMELPALGGLWAALSQGGLSGPLRAGMVARLRASLQRRKAERGLLGFDDLLHLLRDRILDPQAGPDLASALRRRYRAVFIDEFQDTDAVQWAVFERAFHEATDEGRQPSHHLFLIGDPKQAIYRFRGADLKVYLAAAAKAHRRFTMTRNFRSDAAAVEANNLLLGADPVGVFCQPPIEYIRVDAPPREVPARLRGADGQPLPPLSLRAFDPCFNNSAPDVHSDTLIKPSGARGPLRDRLRADLVALLSSGAEVFSGGAWRALRPGDIAVLTRRNAEAALVAEALMAAGVPAIVRSGASVFSTPEAEVIESFLGALIEPGREGPARALALCPGWGWTVPGLLNADAAWEAWLGRLRRWRKLIDESGMMVAFRAAMDELELSQRLLARPGGARQVTNLLHLAELIHAAEQRQRLGLPSLLGWLSRQRSQPPEDAEAVELRLETDDAAVSVVTMHRSKGLEYPVVFLNELWLSFWKDEPPAWVLGRDPEDPEGLARRLDLREGHAELIDVHETLQIEGQQEDMRLLYVAMTRARHRTVVYHAPIEGLERSALGVLLHGGAPDERGGDRSAVAAELAELPPAELWNQLQAWAEAIGSAAPGLLTVERCGPAAPTFYVPPEAPPEQLQVAEAGRARFDNRWRRYSYSAITRGQQGRYAEATASGVDGLERGADPAKPGGDYDAKETHAVAEGEGGQGLPLPLATAPANAEAGTFLHAVYEHMDFTWALEGEPGAARLGAVIDEQLPKHGYTAAAWEPGLRAGLLASLLTPLGGAMGALRLADLPRNDRLDELQFDIPISGGDRWRREGRPLRPVTASAFAEAFGVRGPDAAIGAAYLEGLRALKLGELVGFLTGAIDLVFRAAPAGHPQWFVADYKSNRLPAADGTLTTAAYRPAALRAAMAEHHYFIQYHLYVLALHRYLRARIGPSWSYERDFGGVYYLFFRGMVGPETPTQGGLPAGVFFDRPPFAVIDALDELFGKEEDPA